MVNLIESRLRLCNKRVSQIAIPQGRNAMQNASLQRPQPLFTLGYLRINHLAEIVYVAKRWLSQLGMALAAKSTWEMLLSRSCLTIARRKP